MTDDVRDRLETYIENRLRAGVYNVLAQVGADPAKYRDVVEALLAGEEPPEDAGLPDATRGGGGDVGKPGSPAPSGDRTSEDGDDAEPLGTADTIRVRHTSGDRDDADSHLKNTENDGRSGAKVPYKRRTLDSRSHTRRSSRPSARGSPHVDETPRVDVPRTGV